MIRGLLLSGCVIYPVRQTCYFGLPWAESPQQVEGENLSIRSWARRPGEGDFARVVRDYSWLVPWLRAARKDRYLQLLLLGSVLGLLAASSSWVTFRQRPPKDLLLITIGLLACLGFWFWSAPDVRFGTGFILAAALLGLSIAAATWLRQSRLLSYALPGLLLLIALSGLRGLSRLRSGAFFFSLPQPAVYRVQISRDLSLLVPSVGDQCWGRPLACTPAVNPAALRRVHWPAALEHHTD